MHKHSKQLSFGGQSIDEATKALIMVHGRGASAPSILSLSEQLQVDDFALVAPQANQNTWYPYSFLMPPAQNEPGLSTGLAVIDEIVHDLRNAGFEYEDLYFTGFSQGACLVSEYVGRNAKRYGGLIVFSGGLIGDQIERERYQGDFEGMPIFIGCSDTDFHIPLQRVKESTSVFTELGAKVEERIYPNMGHTIIADELEQANQILIKHL
ncbi:MAG: dienelactone hydrolase family protein [Bacteroidota bacterium]